MKQRRTTDKGFTIIEVMLFLAISGLMMTGVLVIVSGSIERQRYNDVVYSTIDYLKGQYNSTANTHNNRSSDITCSGGKVQQVSVGTSRGTSDCYIAGRIIRSDGSTLVSRPILAQKDITSPDISSATTEKGVLGHMGLLVDSLTDEELYRMGYETHLTKPGDAGTKLPFSMVVVRIPTSNLLRTFLKTGSNAYTVQEIIDESADSVLCVASQGLIRSGNNGISISTGVSGATAVEFAETEQCK
ncbi:MAG TPA: prepilin-type N-terminal cleavage/methylation domain-containing protein [Candidatus Saccharibacteria bacterium]|nr:prepilin-type N-terminal cleavage/methylation domain-containing protein [Candidatus Saccharibacteria bacterium]HMR38534.1 prepilin-type N-terminal cleavage/methylation domain-containing protein [Candidatus Saccharibacteria bacterium]